MMRPSRTMPLVIVLAIAASGCLTRQIPEKHRFLVSTERSGPARLDHDGILRLGRVRVASAFERRNFVYQITDNQLEDDFYNEFYVSPRVMLSANIKDWLTASGLFSSVVDLESIVGARWLVEVGVDSMLVDVRGEGPAKAVLSIEFTLMDTRDSEVAIEMKREYRASVDAAARTAPDFVDAWGRALADILQRFENDLALRVLP